MGNTWSAFAIAPPPIMLETHAKLIRELAERRVAIESCTAAVEAFSDTGSPSFRSDVSRHLETMTGVFDGLANGRPASHAKSTSNAVERLDRLRAGEPDPNAIAARITALDAVTGGLHGGEYVVIGARPSMGKTALAVQLAMNVAEHGGGVAYFSLKCRRRCCHPGLASRLWQPNRQAPSYQALLNGEISESEADYALRPRRR